MGEIDDFVLIWNFPNFLKFWEKTGREGQTQKIGMSKSKFKAIEELMDEKKLEHNIESKVKELLADPNFRKFFQTK